MNPRTTRRARLLDTSVGDYHADIVREALATLRNHGYEASAPQALAALDALVAERDRLREAATFYADERRYEYDEDCCAMYFDTYEGDDAIGDGGQIARAALAPKDTA